jgi:hypothetical protein
VVWESLRISRSGCQTRGGHRFFTARCSAGRSTKVAATARRSRRQASRAECTKLPSLGWWSSSASLISTLRSGASVSWAARLTRAGRKGQLGNTRVRAGTTRACRSACTSRQPADRGDVASAFGHGCQARVTTALGLAGFRAAQRRPGPVPVTPASRSAAAPGAPAPRLAGPPGWGVWHPGPALVGQSAMSPGRGAAPHPPLSPHLRGGSVLRGGPGALPCPRSTAGPGSTTERRVPVAGVTSVTSGDDCGEQGQTGAVTRSSSSLWSADERAGWRHSWQSSPYRCRHAVGWVCGAAASRANASRLPMAAGCLSLPSATPGH